MVAESVDSISRHIQDPYHMARWKATLDPHSGDWLRALPISAIGLRLDDEAVRVAVGIRLGSILAHLTLVHAMNWSTPEGLMALHAAAIRVD